MLRFNAAKHSQTRHRKSCIGSVHVTARFGQQRFRCSENVVNHFVVFPLRKPMPFVTLCASLQNDDAIKIYKFYLNRVCGVPDADFVFLWNDVEFQNECFPGSNAVSDVIRVQRYFSRTDRLPLAFQSLHHFSSRLWLWTAGSGNSFREEGVQAGALPHLWFTEFDQFGHYVRCAEILMLKCK